MAKSSKLNSNHHRWELISCAFKGHATYKPVGSEGELQIAEQLKTTTARGVAWRCLRCGNFILGQPNASGSIDEAPKVARGQFLKEVIILRFLAIERYIKGLFLLLLGYGIIRFKQDANNFLQVFNSNLPAIDSIAKNVNYDLEHSQVIQLIRSALNASQGKLTFFAIAVFSYSAILITEATGLWLMKRWGEYFAVVATSFFIPIEIYEVIHKPTFLKMSALIINVLAVIYLLYSKRLFGLRGGHEAQLAKMHSDKIIQLAD